MNTSGQLDWLAVTFPAGISPNDTMPLPKLGLTWVKTGKPMNGYETRLTNDYGAILLMDGDERQGVHLVLTGETLAQTRTAGITDRAICHHVTANDGKLTRLDVAIDIFAGKLTVGDFARAYTAGRLKSPAKGATHLERLTEPDETFYLGSRASERFFRAYNKGAQMGADDTNWLRLELELKKARANGVAQAIVAEDNTRRVINRAIGDFVQMTDSEELNEVLNDQSDPLPAEGRKLHNTMRWLLEQVAPAVARYQLEHPDENVQDTLASAIALELTKQAAQRKRE